MPFSIWTRCAGASELRRLRFTPWRVVEAQHRVSTRKLVDTPAEQALLEEMIDRVKPPDLTDGKLHYLLYTPFRYAPLPHGSRFGTRHERGIWYGSAERRIAFAEVAYYRLVFLAGTRASLGTVVTPLTAFTATIHTSRGIDLLASPFDVYQRRISSPASYAHSQLLGTEMRAAGVEAFRYRSARDIEEGANIAVFTPKVFGKSEPRSSETWHCFASQAGADFSQASYTTGSTFSFPREQFLVKGMLPVPGP